MEIMKSGETRRPVRATLTLLSAVVLALSVAGCSEGAAGGATETGTQGAVPEAAQTVEYAQEDLDSSWDLATASQIIFTNGSARFDGSGAEAKGGTVTITAAGTYVVSGTGDAGQIVVDLEEDGTVKLVLNGVDLTCADSAPIYVENADKVILTLADGTQNTVTDGSSYVLDDEEAGEPDAAIFSKSHLTINGLGALTVVANYRNGIASKDELKVVSGDITVEAVDDALKGRDCIGVRGGVLTLTAGGDGLKSTNDEEATQGYIAIEGGELDITAGTDGIQAQTTLLVTAGEISMTTGGGSASVSDTDTPSAKGLKAGTGLFVVGGVIDIDSSDDSLHSNGVAQIDGGVLALSSGDDGVHADETLEIGGGELTIAKSYEGLESSVITINDGNIHILSSDDAVNVAGGADGSSVDGRPGQNAFTINEDNRLYINGGYLYVDAGGDGLDCNGRVFMSGGTVLVNGPTSNGNGAMDYMGEFTVTGGLLVAVGSSGMAQAPSTTSSQYSIMVNFSSVQAAGTLVHIADSEGDDILTFSPTKQYQSVVVSSPDIREGASYTVYLGGSSTGTATDSLYSTGQYTPGAEYATLSVSGVVTTSGATGGMGGGMPGGGMRPGR